MIKKFTVDPDRVAKLTSRREALFEVARTDVSDLNDKIAALRDLERQHARSRETIRRWVAPPSELEKLARLKAEVAAARIRAEASRADAQHNGRLADAVAEYAKPRSPTFGGALIKGFSNGQ